MTDADANRLHDVLKDDVRTLTGIGDAAPPTAAVPAETALRTVAPRAVPSIVLSIAVKDPKDVARLLARIPEYLDERVARYPVKIEIRFDTLPDFSARLTAASLVLRLGVPVILTLRARREGGHSTATEPERQRFFLSVVGGLRKAPPPGSLIDIEAQAVAADPEGWAQVIEHAHERGFHVMLSHHDLEVTPERAQALLPPGDLLDKTPGGGALLWKSATTVRTWSQSLAILRALHRGNRGSRRAVVMGLDSPTSRLLAPFFGAPLVYASIDAANRSAAGQVPFADLVHVWSRWGIEVEDHALAPANDAARPRWALIGRPAYHSLSPAMHNAAARQAGRPERYFPIEIPPHTGAGSATDAFQDTLDTLRQIGVTGGNVTIPYKLTLASVAHHLEGDAHTLGAANTFTFDDERIVAHNTDPHGIRAALDEAAVDLAGQHVLVLGAGGAAAAAVLALRDAATLTATNRTPDHAEDLKRVAPALRVVPWEERAVAARDATLIVNTTPLGMSGGPAPDDTPLAPEDLHPGQVVLDTVYVPRRTPLLAAAEAAGARIVDGTRVLLHQGHAAYRIWTGQDGDLAAMAAALEAAGRIPFPDAVRETVTRTEVTA